MATHEKLTVDVVYSRGAETGFVRVEAYALGCVGRAQSRRRADALGYAMVALSASLSRAAAFHERYGLPTWATLPGEKPPLRARARALLERGVAAVASLLED